MTGPGERAGDAALWQRWRMSARAAPGGAPPDPIVLAAWAEGRLDESAAEPVEAWLFEHPEALEDLLAAREAGAAAPPPAPEALIARAAALVPARESNVVSFAAASAVRRSGWRNAVAWGGLAASLLVTSLGGFALGDRAYMNLMGGGNVAATSDNPVPDLLDPPSGLFETDEDSAT